MAHDPAEIDIGSEIRTEDDRGDFGGVGSGESLEYTPGNSLQDGTGEESLDVLGEKWDEDERDHENQGAEHGTFVADSVGYPTIEIQAENLTTLAGITEGCLPLG